MVGNRRTHHSYTNNYSFQGNGLDTLFTKSGRLNSDTSGTIVVRILFNNVSSNSYLFGYGGDAASNPGVFAFRIQDQAGTKRLKVIQRSDGQGTYNQGYATGVAITTATPYFFALIGSGTTWNFNIDGVNTGYTSITGSNNGNWLGDTTVTSGQTRLMGGRWNGNDLAWIDGEYNTCLYYDTDLSEAQLGALKTTLDNNIDPKTLATAANLKNMWKMGDDPRDNYDGDVADEWRTYDTIGSWNFDSLNMVTGDRIASTF